MKEKFGVMNVEGRKRMKEKMEKREEEEVEKKEKGNLRCFKKASEVIKEKEVRKRKE